MSIALDHLTVESFPTTGRMNVHLPTSDSIQVDAGVAVGQARPSARAGIDVDGLRVEPFPTTGLVFVRLPSSESGTIDVARNAAALEVARASARMRMLVEDLRVESFVTSDAVGLVHLPRSEYVPETLLDPAFVTAQAQLVAPGRIAIHEPGVESFPTAGKLMVHLPWSEYTVVDAAEAAATLARAGAPVA